MNRLKLLIVFVGFFAIKGAAQLTTNSELLERSGHSLRLVENANHAKALSLAKQKGWQLNIKTSSGKVGTLVGVDELGYPKYYISQYHCCCYHSGQSIMARWYKWFEFKRFNCRIKK